MLPLPAAQNKNYGSWVASHYITFIPSFVKTVKLDENLNLGIPWHTAWLFTSLLISFSRKGQWFKTVAPNTFKRKKSIKAMLNIRKTTTLSLCDTSERFSGSWLIT